jgi:hypothetical protein
MAAVLDVFKGFLLDGLSGGIPTVGIVLGRERSVTGL